ncbi:MAG: hypothetical protein NVS9B10_06680 [Nevskia sp.]
MPDQAVTDIRAAIALIRERMPFLLTMTPTERRELPRLGEKSIGFDEKLEVHSHSNPEFLPSFMKIEEVDKDRALRRQMLQVEGLLSTLVEAVSDTLAIIGSEIWRADLAYYNNVQEALKRGVPGAKAIYDDLSTRFPRVGRPAVAPPSPPAPVAA